MLTDSTSTLALTRADLRITSDLLQHRNPSEHPFSPHRWQTLRPCSIAQTMYVIVGSEADPQPYPAETLLTFAHNPLITDSDPLPAPTTLPQLNALTPAARTLTIRTMLGYPLPDNEDTTIDTLADEIRAAGITLHPPGRLLELRDQAYAQAQIQPPVPAADAPLATIADHIQRALDDTTLPVPTFAPPLPVFAPQPYTDAPTQSTDQTEYMVIKTLTPEEYEQLENNMVMSPGPRQSWPFKTMRIGQMVRIPPELSEKAIHAAHSYSQSTGYKRFSIRRDPQPYQPTTITPAQTDAPTDDTSPVPDQTNELAQPAQPTVKTPTAVTIVRLSDRLNPTKRNIRPRKNLTP